MDSIFCLCENIFVLRIIQIQLSLAVDQSDVMVKTGTIIIRNT